MELADVILSALTLADSLDIDVNKALNKKIEKIKNR
jgi:NTP pyrophosphatase (non-canonical NTP hydrolase)